MLRYQINPHFLFNSQNSIRALISENKVNAKGMITELAEFLRITPHENYMEVPLNQEIAAIHHYYAIENGAMIQTQHRLRIDPRANDFPIISFLIHPLVENAIKYGMRTSSMPLKIQVRVDLHSDRLSVSVRNSGHWIEPPPETQPSEDSTGTGLQNVRHRLDSAYPDRHTFIIDKKDDSVCICFEIFQRGKTDEEPL
jgi:LytS/YehU family sensor histidine kinase